MRAENTSSDLPRTAHVMERKEKKGQGKGRKRKTKGKVYSSNDAQWISGFHATQSS